ncbi:MAG: hypothetical protein ACLPVW_08985 [Terriglobales bacterium]
MKITKLFLAVACMVVLGASTFAQTPTTGTYSLTINITLASTIPSATQIVCLVQIDVTGDSVLSGIEQTAGSAATRSGDTATCTVTIPYSWELGTPATDKLDRVYSILAPVEATYGKPVPVRSAHLNLGSIAMPANGATTTETVTATL